MICFWNISAFLQKGLSRQLRSSNIYLHPFFKWRSCQIIKPSQHLISVQSVLCFGSNDLIFLFYSKPTSGAWYYLRMPRAVPAGFGTIIALVVKKISPRSGCGPDYYSEANNGTFNFCWKAFWVTPNLTLSTIDTAQSYTLGINHSRSLCTVFFSSIFDVHICFSIWCKWTYYCLRLLVCVYFE